MQETVLLSEGIIPSVHLPGCKGWLERFELYLGTQKMMDNKLSALIDDHGILYEIKIKGHLDEHWSDWLGDLKITHDSCGNTLLSGSIIDQAALYGILAQIRDLGLTLISLTPQRAGEAEDESPGRGFDRGRGQR